MEQIISCVLILHCCLLPTVLTQSISCHLMVDDCTEPSPRMVDSPFGCCGLPIRGMINTGGLRGVSYADGSGNCIVCGNTGCHSSPDCNALADATITTANECCAPGGASFLDPVTFTCSRCGGGTTGNDPHFFIPLPNGDNLCYSVQGQPDFMFSLIKDTYVQLNGQFVLPASDESNTIANVSTFLGNLGLLLRSPATGKSVIVKVSAQEHSVQIGDETVTVDDEPVHVMIASDLNITTIVDNSAHERVKDETAWFYLNTELGFGMKIRFYKKHLDMMITRGDGLTSRADGFMGQFMGKEIEIDTEYNMMKIGDHKPIPVVKALAWHFLGTDEECWYGKSTNNQGGGVIEGNYMDYVVEELLPSS